MESLLIKIEQELNNINQFNSEKIEVKLCNFRKDTQFLKDTERLYSYFFEATGIILPQAEKGLLTLGEKTGYYWQGKNEFQNHFGIINLGNLDNIFQIKTYKYLNTNTDYLSNESLSILENCYYFDTYPYINWDTCTLLYLKEGMSYPSIYFLHKRIPYLLPFSISEYINKALFHKGAYYWQLHYIDDKSNFDQFELRLCEENKGFVNSENEEK